MPLSRHLTSLNASTNGDKMPIFQIPIGNDCIIHPFKYPEKIGLLHVPDRSKKRTNQGIIIAKGPLVSDDLDTADHVFFNGYTGDQIAIEGGGRFFVIPEPHIICRVRNSKVVLMDTVTVKRIIGERFGELHSSVSYSFASGSKIIVTLEDIEQSLLDRIESITVAEGWDF